MWANGVGFGAGGSGAAAGPPGRGVSLLATVGPGGGTGDGGGALGPPSVTGAAWNAAGTQLTVTFDKAVTGTAGFSVVVPALYTPLVLTYSAGDGSASYTYTAGRAAVAGESTTLSYAPGTVQSLAGAPLAGFTGQAVGDATAYNPLADTPDFLLEMGPTWCFSDAGGTVPCGVGDPIRVFKDRSGHTRNFSEATAGLRPTLQKTGGGKWFARFDGVDDVAILSPYAGSAAVGSLTAAAVVLQAAGSFPALTSSAAAIIDNRWDEGTRQFTATTGESGSSKVTSPTASTLGTGYRLMAQRDYGAHTCTLYENGTVKATGADANTLTAPNGFSIGARQDGSNPAQIDLYGLFYKEAVLDNTALANVDAYLAGLL